MSAVAVFDPVADLDRLDFRLMLDSFVTLFWRLSVYDEAVTWMADHGYTTVGLNAHAWSNEADMHRDIAEALGFPEYYGRNLDALNDCLRDVVDYRYGTTRSATGLLIAFTGYDAFAEANPPVAQAVLDVFAGQARCAALTGHRLLCLVQSNNPRIVFDRVGATPVPWNSAEWLDARRVTGTDPHPLLP